MLSSHKKEVLEYSISPEDAFTSSAIYGSKAEVFSDMPHVI